MAKKPQSRNGKGGSRRRSAKTGRFVAGKGVSREAREFSSRFNERYRETLRDLSKR